MYRIVQFLKRPATAAAYTQQRELSILASIDWQSPDRTRFRRPCRIQNQQVRFRRHDRASAFSKPRPKTKKQRQEYNRRMKKVEEEKAKHSAPGSRAGPRRQFLRERKQELLEYAEGHGKELSLMEDDNDLQYGMEDALIEDILGNTAHLTSQPTPEPVYLGHKHKQYYNAVSDQMDRYRAAIDAQAASDKSSGSNDHAVLHLATGEASLPSDQAISKVLRAYRDRNGTRSKPIGIVMALEHILKDLGVPTKAFGEFTYTALLTCCRTPIEARRIFKLMTDNQHPISAYSWSILVDIHAKLGDFEGCATVIKEMALNGTPPSQAAYTSLLAACYKVCNDGRIPHSIRAKAGEVGWEHWQEMRIVGIEADAMAYGAIIRLCGARGQAERAIGLLHEMNRFDVKPTTLCFSGALRAVARSHEIGVRFERGSSRRQLRRELFTSHHGNMARQIVIMAESAQVEQDEGFVSALMLCAAAAGDSATAKAIYLAAEVRKMDHLRTIGSESSLQQLRGGAKNNDLHRLDMEQRQAIAETTDGTDSNGSLVEVSSTGNASSPEVYQGRENRVISFGEREYGKDTRALSALLRSCGQAIDSNSLGTIWAGKQNQGYLCEDSLRLITTRWEPSYTKTSIPSELSTKVGINSLRRFDENDREEERKKGAARQKFRGLYLDDDAVSSLEEYSDLNDSGTDDSEVMEFFGKSRKNKTSADLQGPAKVPESPKTESSFKSSENLDVELWDDMSDSDEDDETIPFEIFFEELKAEAKRNGMEEELSEEDARELYVMMQEEFLADDDDDDADEDYSSAIKSESGNVRDEISSLEANESMPFEQFYDELKEEAKRNGMDQELTEEEIREFYEIMQKEDLVDEDVHGDSAGSLLESGKPFDSFRNAQTIPSDKELLKENGAVSSPGSNEATATSKSLNEKDESEVNAVESAIALMERSSNNMSSAESTDLMSIDADEMAKISELQTALPGMPLHRLRKIAEAFSGTLSYPSMLTLVPLLRETMPDTLTSGWLKRTNTRNAEFVLEKAKEDGLVNLSLLNAMLQVKTKASALDEAEKFHSEVFREHNLKPTAYSDRLVLQMLLSNSRPSRALRFKQRIENEKRTLDIPSYGSLVEYYSRHGQLGTAMMLLKECISVHGSPPGEASLKSLRLLCKKHEVDDEVQLNQMIGVDPIEWLKHGERHLKRERSKKGRRDIRLAYL